MVSITTGNLAAASYSAAAVEATVNEAEDYLVGRKELTGSNVMASTKTVLQETAINGSVYALTGALAGNEIRINKGWIQPTKIGRAHV